MVVAILKYAYTKAHSQVDSLRPLDLRIREKELALNERFEANLEAIPKPGMTVFSDGPYSP